MDAILAPIMWVVAWIIYACHQLFTLLGFREGPGLAWILAIVALTAIMRTAMIPLFFRQIKAARGMQLVQPEIQAIQKRYKDKKDQASREAMTRETMAVYKKHGTNPMSSCMPALLQSPVFFALFRVLAALPGIGTGERPPIGPIDQIVANDIQNSAFFGARLSDVFMTTDSTVSRIVVVALIVAMAGTMFFTQRQLTMKNMPQAALEGPMASTQKIMLYGMPLIFAVTGVNFPVGVLIYWTVTNLWSMGQQYYSIKRMPAPGSAAERELKARRAAKAAAKGIVLEPEPFAVGVSGGPKGQREQPKRKNRNKRG